MTSYHKLFQFLKNHWKILVCYLLMLFIGAGSFLLNIQVISDNMPYPGHFDEKFIIEPALSMLKSGDFNPHSFRYPSLPIYMTAMSFSIGFLSSAKHLEITKTKEISTNSHPYFKHPRIIWYGKVWFALLSIVAMFFMAFVAYRFFKNPLLLVGVPLVLSLSLNYHLIAAQYINVNTAATFFIACIFLHHALNLEKESNLHKVVLPGIFSGLVIACKYNLFLITVPSILVILFYIKKRKASKILALFLIMGLTFLIVVPYSLLDFNVFLDWLAFDIRTYSDINSPYAGQTGFSQFLFHLNYFFQDYGLIFCLLALLGVVASFFPDWKKGILFLSFPLLLLLHLSSYSLHFPRNIHSLFIFFALYAVLGIFWLYKAVVWLIQKIPLARSRKSLQLVTASILIALLLLSPAQTAMSKIIIGNKDSRYKLMNWLKTNVERGRTLIFAEELGLYLKPLEKNYNIVALKFYNLMPEAIGQKLAEFEKPLIIMPQFRSMNNKSALDNKKVESLNGFRGFLKTICAFGKAETYLNNPKLIIYNNPKIYVAEPLITNNEQY